MALTWCMHITSHWQLRRASVLAAPCINEDRMFGCMPLALFMHTTPHCQLR